MSNKIVQGSLAAAVADAGTFVVSYPAKSAPESGSTDEGDFYLAMGHKLILGQNNVLSFPDDFDVTLGTASITITNKTGSTWAAGQDFTLELQEQGKPVFTSEGDGKRMAAMARSDTFLINLGAPDVADANGVCASQSINTGTPATINGALASGGVATFDVPRNVVAAWTGTAVMTVTGVDAYGKTVVESSASGTSMAGKKAFKKVTKVEVSANVTSATVGTGDVLGLPVFLPGAGHVLKELEDGAAASAGTLVAGIRTAGGSTATTGDVRGTYDPNSAADGQKVFQLIVSLPDPGYKGIAQYAG